MKTTQKAFPAKLLTMSTIITLLTLAWFALFSINLYQNFKTEMERNISITELKGKILQYDEILTMSARMAVATGDLKWEERYLKYEIQLETAIKKLIGLAPSAFYSSQTEKTNAANTQLVHMEKNAFKEIRNGNLEAATEILYYPSYKRYKTVYANGINHATLTLDNIITERIEKLKTATTYNLLLIITSTIFLIAVWLKTFTSFKKWKLSLETKATSVNLNTSVS